MPDPGLPADMFRPPVDRAMRVLYRPFFRKKIPLAVATVFEKNQISMCRGYLKQDLLNLDRVSPIRFDASAEDSKLDRRSLLLKPSVRPDEPSTWTSKIQELVDEKKVAIQPYTFEMTYDDWSYLDILSSILPEHDQDELPTGFSIVGHVAHFNLRDQYLQYKYLIADVLMDKNPGIKTVINKIDIVGAESEFRTFKCELLAGNPSLDVETRLLNCTFRFNYSKVYWSSRLTSEHERIVNLFQEGEVVCDVMAGVGPFAVPAGKKGVFVWANDLNPDCYTSLKEAISRNKVPLFVRPFNMDGRAFIRDSAKELREETLELEYPPAKPKRVSRSAPPTDAPPPPPSTLKTQPKTFDHYVMNLPASAITFLDVFIGLYHGHEELFKPHTSRKLPMIHVYCFSTKSDDNKAEAIKICKAISDRIGYQINPDDEDVKIWDVRDVAPQKRLFCASFRLPPEVVFR